jgi:hypothetical protein
MEEKVKSMMERSVSWRVIMKLNKSQSLRIQSNLYFDESMHKATIFLLEALVLRKEEVGDGQVVVQRYLFIYLV